MSKQATGGYGNAYSTDLEPPWHVKYMGLLTLGGIVAFAIAATITIISMVSPFLSDDLDIQTASAQVEIAEAQPEPQIETIQPKADQPSLALYILALAVFYAIAWRYSGPWGVGIATFILAMIAAIYAGLFPVDALRVLMGAE